MKITKLMIAIACCGVMLTGCKDDETQYAVTVTSDANGTASASAAKAEEGTTITLSATAKEGYEFAEWTVKSGGVTLSDKNDPKATFTMPAKDVEISAAFAQTYAVTVNSGDNGEASADVAKAAKDATVTLTAVADTGYKFSKWTVDSENVTLSSATEATATFTMPAEAVEVSAEFVKVYTVTVNIEGSEGTAVATPSEAAEGDVVTLTFTATGTGISFQRWVVDSENVTLEEEEQEETTFTMPAADVEITAYYASIGEPPVGPGK